MSHTIVPRAPNEIWRRVAITVAALLGINVLARIPLPGVDVAALMGNDARAGGMLGALAGGGVWGRLSIGALSIWPLFSSFFLFEVWRTVTGKRYGGDLAGPEQPRVLAWIVGLALLLSAYQAFGVATALEQFRPVPKFVVEPGLEFRIGAVASMVGATAILCWLMTVITQHGIGSGFWVLFAASSLQSLLPSAASVLELTRQGAVTASTLPILVGLLIAGTAVLAALDKARDETGAALALDPWAPLMGVTLYFLWASVVQIFVPFDTLVAAQGFSGTIAPGSWAYVVGVPLTVAAVAMLRAVRFNATATAPQPLSRALPGIAAVVGICFAGALASHVSEGLILGTQNLVPVVITVLAVMAALARLTQAENGLGL